MLKYLLPKHRDHEGAIAHALAERLRGDTGHYPREQQFVLVGHTSYCRAYSIDVVTGEILAEYASKSALPFEWRSPLAVSTLQQPVDVPPAMSSQDTIELLKRMMSSADTQTVEQWDELRIQLDQNRTSDRKLFNE